jgi:hypothetical protein
VRLGLRPELGGGLGLVVDCARGVEDGAVEDGAVEDGGVCGLGVFYVQIPGTDDAVAAAGIAG